MDCRRVAVMRIRPLKLALGRAKEVLLAEGILRREASPEPRRKKDLSKIKCFECHDYGPC